MKAGIVIIFSLHKFHNLWKIFLQILSTFKILFQVVVSLKILSGKLILSMIEKHENEMGVK